MNRFVNDHEDQQKQQRAAEEDTRKTKQLLAMLPDTLTFSYAQSEGDTVQLNFQPNPAFHPSSREAHVFHEMEGQLTVDRKEERLAGINGHLMHDVRFGGGILGHLDQGGTFDVHQEQVAANHWEIMRLKSA
jgi:hypothetical protein